MKKNMLPEFTPPAAQCNLCPRLVDFRTQNQQKYPNFHNGAVSAFGGLDAKLLVIGLAPGLKGANQTGRPFTGDYAGDVLYGALQKAGLADGQYDKRPDDGLRLQGVRITNAVRCVPPQNKPTPEEVHICGRFLKQEIAAMPHLRVMLCLGRISHEATLRVLGLKQKDFPFAHAAEHRMQIGERTLLLVDSYHTSRYNVQTGRLTFEMFDRLIFSIAKAIDAIEFK